MFAAFSKAFAQLADPAVRRILLKSTALTLLIFAVAAALLGWLLTGSNPCGIGPLDGSCEIGGSLGTAAAIVLGIAGLWFLFPAVAMGVIGFFSDEIVDAVEARHYPAAVSRQLPLARSLSMSVRSFGRILLWNLLALPFYILLLVTGVGPFFLFSAVNALALGRDLGEMVAARHLQGEALSAWLAATRGRRALLGLATAWLFLIPFANLLAPLVGAAAATHLFHGGRR